jgi:hypothetical protein
VRGRGEQRYAHHREEKGGSTQRGDAHRPRELQLERHQRDVEVAPEMRQDRRRPLLGGVFSLSQEPPLVGAAQLGQPRRCIQRQRYDETYAGGDEQRPADGQIRPMTRQPAVKRPYRSADQ